MQTASLKEEFKLAAETAKPLIDAQLEAAKAALIAAKRIAQEYGVPFESGIVDNTYDKYFPASFNAKFGKLKEEFEEEDDYSEFIEDLATVYTYGNDNTGWQKSYC